MYINSIHFRTQQKIYKREQQFSSHKSQANLIHSNTLDPKAKLPKWLERAAKTPLNIISGVFWLFGDLINTVIQNAMYQRDPNISELNRLCLIGNRFSKMFADAFLFYIPSGILESYARKNIVPKVLPKMVHKEHMHYSKLAALFGFVVPWIVTMPLNEIVKPVLQTRMVSYIVSHIESMPNWILRLLGFNKARLTYEYQGLDAARRMKLNSLTNSQPLASIA